MLMRKLNFTVFLFAITLLFPTGFVCADSTVVFNEIMYHPAEDADATGEWMEFYNQMAVDMDISGWSIKGGLEYDFPADTIIPGRSYFVVAISPASLQAASGYSGAFGPFDGQLSNSGEVLRLVSHNGRIMDELVYSDGGDWPVAPDGGGVSLAKIDRDFGSARARSWTFSAEVGGTVGTENFPSDFDPGDPVVIAELNRWCIDFQGDENHLLVYGQTDPVDMTEPGVYWNIFEVPALDAPYPGPVSYASAPVTLTLLDYGGNDVGVVFTDLNDAWGWAGSLDQEAEPLLGDYLILLNSFGVDCDPSSWQITGLESDDWYELIYYHGPTDGRGIHFIANGVSTYVLGSGGNIVSALVKSDSVGRIVGTAASEGSEGNWSGLVIRHVLVQEPDPDGGEPFESIQLALNEISSVLDSPFRIEIVNYGNEAVALDQMVLACSREECADYVLGVQSLPAGGYLVIEPGWTAADGDRIFFYTSGRDSIIDAAVIRDRHIGRYPQATGQWAYPDALTFGSENTFDFHDEIVINEIMYHAFPILEMEGTPGTYQTTPLVEIDAEWRYNQSGDDLGDNWHLTAHPVDNIDWFEGQALLGLESASVPEPIRTDLTVSSSQITYYFETDFEFAGNPDDVVNLQVNHIIDDGAVFYINGVEVYRFNMDSGDVNSSTLANPGVGDAVYSGPINIPVGALVNGTNLFSVEVHQVGTTSTDIVFGTMLQAMEEIEPATPRAAFTESDEEWIELRNDSLSTVDLTGWKLEGGIEYEFPPGTKMWPKTYLVVAKDSSVLAEKYPTADVLGDFSGRLANEGDSVILKDENGNVADSVSYFDGKPWPGYADGGGSSLERRDMQAAACDAQNWASSNDSAEADWKRYSYRGTAAEDGIGYNIWNEFCLGLLDSGQVLLDDISVVEDPDGAAVELIQNGSFESDTLGMGPAKWRLLGNHGTTHGQSVVVVDPDDSNYNVLHLVVTGYTRHEHNHAETTLANGAVVSAGKEYEISFRARWVAGCNRLNTRLYFNWLQNTINIDVPATGGTCGGQNTSYRSNVGPTFRLFNHSPVVPEAGQDVTVSVRAEDPDSIFSMTLYYAVNNSSWNMVSMSNPDNDRYVGVIPGGNSGDVVQFYIRGRDMNLMESYYPAGGVGSRAMYAVQDGQADTSLRHSMRILMTNTDWGLLLTNTNLMSNHRLGATVIYDERQAYYDVRVRLKGSAWGRTHSSETGFNIEFDTDNLFQGVHRTIAIERGSSRREIIAKHMFNAAGGGLGNLYDDVAYIINPNTVYYGGIGLLSMARFTDVFLDTQYENGGDGMLYNYELLYTPLYTVDGNPESLKLNYPYTHTNGSFDFGNYGSGKEPYRWWQQIRNNYTKDDFSLLIEFNQAVALTGQELNYETQRTMDVSQWMRTFSMESLIGNDDFYGRVHWHNLRMYQRPEDNKLVALPWDLDRSFNLAIDSPLWSTGNNMQKVIELPVNKRLFFGHTYDMIQSTCNSSYMSYWINHYSTMAGQDYSWYLTYIQSRADWALSQLPVYVDFAFTDPNFTVDTDYAEIHGQAWINVKDVFVDGIDEPLDLTWTSSGTGTDELFYWQASVPLAPGENNLLFTAYDFQGNLIATDSITAISTSTQRPLRDYLRVTELMYDPIGGSDYEFIELCNTGTEALDLTHAAFTDGIEFIFADGYITSLAPGEYLVVVKDETAFASRYGASGINVAGQYIGKLENGGEKVHLQGRWNSEILTFDYSDGRGWPLAADGAGHSLIPLSSAVSTQSTGSLDYCGNWRQSAYINGSPGASDPDLNQSVLLNEICAHTDFNDPVNYPDHDSNDWVELYNTTASTINLDGNWYLSDDISNLQKWSLPDIELAGGGYVTFDEITGFHNPITTGFGLDKAGEQVFLSFLSGGEQDRVVDCVKFKAQPNNASLGRYPDGDQFWYELAPTRNEQNTEPTPSIVISEVMYNPLPYQYEYIELYNSTSSPILLWDSQISQPWRLDGAVSYEFNETVSIPAQGYLIVVEFIPDAVTLAEFESQYGSTDAQIIGPYSGALSNDTERLGLERPQGSDDPANPYDISWIIVDEVIYSDQSPWPPEADGVGGSLQRIRVDRTGNDPDNFKADLPNVGFWISIADFDSSGTVDILDLLVLSDTWLTEPWDAAWNGACDISNPADDFIDLYDFAVFAQFWGI